VLRQQHHEPLTFFLFYAIIGNIARISNDKPSFYGIRAGTSRIMLRVLHILGHASCAPVRKGSSQGGIYRDDALAFGYELCKMHKKGHFY